MTCVVRLVGLLRVASTQTGDPATMPRVIVLTDIEADPDDSQPLVRPLLYANEVELEGPVAMSTWQPTRVVPKSIK